MLALTPVAVLMFRFNNPDALLVLLMVAAAYATVRAVEKAGTRWLLLAGVLLGFGVPHQDAAGASSSLPALAAAYLWAAPTGLWRRVRQLLAAGVAIVVVGGWWFARGRAVAGDATGPYIGGSTNNSALELAFGYNGLGRIFGGEGSAAVAAERPTRLERQAFPRRGGSGRQASQAAGRRTRRVASRRTGRLRGWRWRAFGGQAGLGRLFANDVGGQIALAAARGAGRCSSIGMG